MIDVVRFNPGDEHHCGFLFDSVMEKRHEADGARWPFERYEPIEMRNRLHEALRHVDTECLVGQVEGVRGAGGKPLLMGWAAVNRGVIVGAFTRFKLRRNGYASHLLDLLGIDTVAGAPVGLMFWSPAASRIVAAGKRRLYPIPMDDLKEHFA